MHDGEEEDDDQPSGTSQRVEATDDDIMSIDEDQLPATNQPTTAASSSSSSSSSSAGGASASFPAYSSLQYEDRRNYGAADLKGSDLLPVPSGSRHRGVIPYHYEEGDPRTVEQFRKGLIDEMERRELNQSGTAREAKLINDGGQPYLSTFLKRGYIKDNERGCRVVVLLLTWLRSSRRLHPDCVCCGARRKAFPTDAAFVNHKDLCLKQTQELAKVNPPVVSVALTPEQKAEVRAQVSSPSPLPPHTIPLCPHKYSATLPFHHSTIDYSSPLIFISTIKMVSEGWLFDAGANPYLGMRVRRFFVGFGKSDGVLVAYLPPDKNEGRNQINPLTSSFPPPTSYALLAALLAYIFQLHSCVD